MNVVPSCLKKSNGVCGENKREAGVYSADVSSVFFNHVFAWTGLCLLYY